MQKAPGTRETNPISVYVSMARCGKSVLLTSLFILEGSHGDKDYPSRNNIAVGRSLSAKVELLLQKRESGRVRCWFSEQPQQIIGKIRTALGRGAGLENPGNPQLADYSLETWLIQKLGQCFSNLLWHLAAAIGDALFPYVPPSNLQEYRHHGNNSDN